MHPVDEQRGIGRLKVNKTFLIFSNEALYDYNNRMTTLSKLPFLTSIRKENSLKLPKLI
jgi:hypothetical protein